MSQWIEERIIEAMSASPTFTLQLNESRDESTDVSGLAELMVYVRYFKGMHIAFQPEKIWRHSGEYAFGQAAQTQPP
jgi:hypothetical protein